MSVVHLRREERHLEVDLFVDDHSRIVQLACLRSGLWGTQSVWGRALTYTGS